MKLRELERWYRLEEWDPGTAGPDVVIAQCRVCDWRLRWGDFAGQGVWDVLSVGALVCEVLECHVREHLGVLVS